MAACSSEERERTHLDPEDAWLIVFTASRLTHKGLHHADEIILWSAGPARLYLVVLNYDHYAWECALWALTQHSEPSFTQDIRWWALARAGYDPTSWQGVHQRFKGNGALPASFYHQPASFFMRHVLMGSP